MPDGSIPCPVCGNYDNTHKFSCHRYMPLSIIRVDDDGEMTITLPTIGWECPICHRGLSPDVTICEHSGVDMDSVMEQIQAKDGIYGDKIVSDDAIKEQMFSGSPINFDLWKGLQWYEDEDED